MHAQWLSHVRFFATPWTAAHQASLSFTISRSSGKLMSIKLMMLSNHLILCICVPSAHFYCDLITALNMKVYKINE